MTAPTAHEGVAFVSTIPPSALGELAPGARVERYVVLKKLGAGGMGIVYMAYDEELDRRIALKLLVNDGRDAREGDDTGGAAQRLLREAQAMAKLSHPNVVAVYDVGTYGEQVFLAMEFVDGPTLRKWREASPRATRDIIAMYAQAGRGLEAAHAAGILHRDFKPDNAVVDGRGRVRVLDFGLARIDPSTTPLDDMALATTGIVSGRTSSEPLTHAGALVGTPGYMSPEQLTGHRAEGRSDQFAFSVSLYEALYNERPHHGRTMLELRDAIVGERIRPPPRGAKVPRRVRNVLVRGLRARPDDRFATMGDLLDALDRAITAPRRYAIVTAAIAGAAIVAAVVPARAHGPVCAGADQEIAEAWGAARSDSVARAFVASGNPRADETWGRVRGALDAYAKAWSKMRTESCEATRVRGVQSDEALDLRTACLDQRRRELGATSDILAGANAKLVDDAVTMVSALTDLGRCADVPALRAPYARPRDEAQRRAVDGIRQRVAQGTALFYARRLGEAETVLSTAARDAKAAQYPPLDAEALLFTGRAAIEQGKAEQALSTLRDAAFEANVARDEATEAGAWIWLVRVAGYDLGRFEEGELYARFADAAIQRSGGGDALRADLVRHRAHALYAREQTDAALGLYREALALRQRAFGAGSAESAEVEVDLADIQFDKGHMREAIALYQSSLAKRVAIYGEGNPVVGSSLANLATMQEQVGAADDAAATARRALATIHEEDKYHPIARAVLARALVSQGDVAGGMAQAREAFAEHVQKVGEGSWKLALPHDLWAQTLLRRHLIDAALPEAEQAILLLASADLDPSTLRWAREIRALCRARRGRPAEALVEAERALADEERTSGAVSANLMLPLLAVGEAALGAKDTPRALASLERAFVIAEGAEGYPELHADIHLALARALASAHAGVDRARALAERAASEYDAARLPELAREARGQKG